MGPNGSQGAAKSSPAWDKIRSKGLGPGPQRTLLLRAMSTFSLLFPVPVVGSKKRKIACDGSETTSKAIETHPKSLETL